MKAPPSWWYSRVGGDRRAAFYKWYAVNPRSRGSATKLLRDLEAFCLDHGFPTKLPLHWRVAEAWVAGMAPNYSAAGIKKRLYILRTHHIDIGLDASYLQHRSIERTIRGIKKYHGQQNVKRAVPITLPILRRILTTLDTYPAIAGGRHNADTYATAFSVAFAGFFRMGELTYDSFNPTFHSRRADVNLQDGTMFVPASKTDPFRNGTLVSLPTAVNDKTVDPIRRLRRHFAAYPARQNDPLFCLYSQNGTPKAFTRTRVVAVLQGCLDEAGIGSGGFTGHSFRRGAATWAASIGVRDEDIMRLGRWSSKAWKAYVDEPPATKSNRINRLYDVAAAARSSIPSASIPPKRVRWAPTPD